MSLCSVALCLMFGAYGVGAAAALLSIASARTARWVGHMALLVGAGAGVWLSVQVLTTTTPDPVVIVPLPALFPFAHLSLAFDGLGAFFLLVVSLITVAAALFGPAYLAAHPTRSPAAEVAGINVFVGSMALVLGAHDALTFLLAWEGMTLASYVLVVSEGGETSARAGLVYVGMAHAGAALLIVVFLSLANRAGSFDFPALRLAAAALPPAERSVLFFLVLGGLAAKAGAVPLHVWLPLAHPAAPSHASALMSGVMLKVAIYALLRFGLDLLAPSGALPPSWGWTIVFMGATSAVLGVLYALQQHDLKRLLAFHSVENVGIILLGVGIAMLLAHRGAVADTLSALGLAAALLHTLNHAAFKGLLFLGAGSIQAATHRLNMEGLGGLARRMPWTAWLFLVGAIAISALPPLNGFVSEWMTFQALVLGGAELGGAQGLAAVVATSALALTGGLAAACFVKAFGVTFLGRARSPQAAEAKEVAPSMRAAMMLLAAVCVLVGVLPGHVIALLDAPVRTLLGGAPLSALVTVHGPLVLTAQGASAPGTSLSLAAAAGLFAILAVVVWAVVAWPRATKRRLAPTWTCGMTPGSRFDYTATAFAKPLRSIFSSIYRPRPSVRQEPGQTSYALRSMHWEEDIVDIAETQLYRRLYSGVMRVAAAVRRRSTGSIHGYIAYVLVTLLLTLLALGRA